MTARPILIGESAEMVEVRRRIQKAAQTDVPVIVVGESGSGKDEAARLIHFLSPRRDRNFVARSCARLTGGVAQSELFGHERGAFTTAITATRGAFAHADGGTFLLNELHRAQPEAQDLLVELLDGRGYHRVGGTVEFQPDVRLVTASSVPPASLAALGRLDEHLLYRLGARPIMIPALRERIEDIEDLLQHVMCLWEARYRLSKPVWQAGALSLLKEYHWPGNVRQFAAVVRDVMADTPGVVDVALVREILLLQTGNPACAPTECTDVVERTAAAMKLCGSQAKVASHLGVCEKTVYRRLKKAQKRAGGQGG